MRKYDYVIFDLDGTLLNTKSGIISALIEAAAKLGLQQIPEHEYNSFIGPPIEQSVREYFELNDTQVKEAAAIFRKYYAEKYLFDAYPYEGVSETLKQLNNAAVKMAVATYKRHEYAVKVIEHFELNKYCFPCLGSNLDRRTTKTITIRECISEMNADIRRTVYIGDTEHDRIAASEAGIDFIGVTFGFGYGKENDLAISVDSFSEIAKVIIGE